MAGDWINWSQFYDLNESEAQRQSQEEADKFSQSQREMDSALAAQAKNVEAGGKWDVAALQKQAQAARGNMRQTGMSSPWENALYKGDAKLNYGDAWGQLGSRLAGYQAQQQQHDRLMAQQKEQAALAKKYTGPKKASASDIKVRRLSAASDPRTRMSENAQYLWEEQHPEVRRTGETEDAYRQRMLILTQQG